MLGWFWQAAPGGSEASAAICPAAGAQSLASCLAPSVNRVSAAWTSGSVGDQLPAFQMRHREEDSKTEEMV